MEGQRRLAPQGSRQHGRLVVLASGAGSNLQAILDATRSGRIPAQVVAVMTNRDGIAALDRARRADVPAHALLPESGEARAAYDARLADAVEAYAPDLVVLAGWMRILTMPFLGRFPGRVLNLHPALPGELPGTHAIERAHAEFVAGSRTRTGVMVHLVPDEGVDDGPVLATVDVPILPGDTVDELATRVHAAEHVLLVDAIAAFLRTSHDTPLPVS